MNSKKVIVPMLTITDGQVRYFSYFSYIRFFYFFDQITSDNFFSHERTIDKLPFGQRINRNQIEIF